jgi:hypothetical protein
MQGTTIQRKAAAKAFPVEREMASIAVCILIMLTGCKGPQDQGVIYGMF